MDFKEDNFGDARAKQAMAESNGKLKPAPAEEVKGPVPQVLLRGEAI